MSECALLIRLQVKCHIFLLNFQWMNSVDLIIDWIKSLNSVDSAKIEMHFFFTELFVN